MTASGGTTASGGAPTASGGRGGAAGGTSATSGGFAGNTSASGGVAGTAGTGGGGASGGPGRVVENPVLDVVVGGRHACALLADHSVWCWGYEFDLDREWPSISPGLSRPVSGITIVPQSLSGNFNDNCVADAAGQSLCWGYNEQGQLGDGTTDNRPGPAPVSGGISWAR